MRLHFFTAKENLFKKIKRLFYKNIFFHKIISKILKNRTLKKKKKLDVIFGSIKIYIVINSKCIYDILSRLKEWLLLTEQGRIKNGNKGIKSVAARKRQCSGVTLTNS